MALARSVARLFAAFGLVVLTATPSWAGVSPQGDTAAAWPAGWSAYRTTDGSAVMDVLGDENPDNADLSSGQCTGTGCTGGLPTVYYASDGTNAFFRMRLAVDPADATKGGLTGNAYLTQIAVGGTVVAVVGVDGKSASVDYVYVASAPGTTVTQVYTWPFTSPSAGMRVVPDGTGDWFLDYQVPIARITALSGGAVTAATGIQLYYGSSAAANLATLNKDLMRGDVSAVSFTGLATVSLSPSSLTATSSALHTSGPAPTEGQASRYTITLTTTNGGGGELSSAVATATLPAGVTFVSSPDVTVSGSTVTWNAGTLLAGQTKTTTFVVDLVPSAPGPSAPLLSALAVNGTDVGTGGARSASAAPLSVGPVGAAAVNATPVAAADTLTVAEDGSGNVNVLTNDSDADGDTLTVTVTGAPAHGTTSVAGGVVTYTPAANYSGPDSFTYTACDPSGACDSATVTVNVTAVNDAPAPLAATSFSTPEDTAHSGSLPAGSDPDGDALAYSVVTQPSHGTVTVNPNGSYTYTPAPDYAGPDTFSYQVCDAGALCASATATVTVTPVNDPPFAGGTVLSTPEDTAFSGSLPAAADVDGDALTYSVTTQPSHGTVTIAPDGSFTYTPDPNYSGEDSFGYQACDPGALCSPAVASVTVTPVNDPPVGPLPSTATTVVDTPLAGTLPGGSDPDGDPLTFSATTLPAHGTLVVNPDGTYTYTPAPGYVGGDSFGYQVCDPGPLCAGTTVTVTVTPVAPPPNVAPVAVDDVGATVFGTTVVVNVLANDVDTDQLTVTSVTQGANGAVSIVAGGVSYVPATGFSGNDTFTYTVCDPFMACDTATVTVTVAAKGNTPPVADAGPDKSASAGAVQLDGTGSSDADGDTLTYVWTQVSGPVVTLLGATTATPTFVMPAAGGPVVLMLTVSDGTATDTDTVTVTRSQVIVDPPPPTCSDESVTTSNGAPATVTLDCEGTVTIVDGPEHGDVEVLDDGTIRYVPDPGYTGPDSFVVRVCAGAGCDLATVSVGNTNVRRPSTLPDTGASGVELMVPVAFVLILAGAASLRRGSHA